MGWATRVASSHQRNWSLQDRYLPSGGPSCVLQALKMLGPLRIPELADNFIVMDADLRYVRPISFFQLDAAGAAYPVMVWSDHVHVSAGSMVASRCTCDVGGPRL